MIIIVFVVIICIIIIVDDNDVVVVVIIEVNLGHSCLTNLGNVGKTISYKRSINNL